MDLLRRPTGALLAQCRRPTGRFGSLVARSMNRGHAKVTVWGLGHIDVDESATVLDVGCGGGATVRRLAAQARRGSVCGIDYSECSVATARRACRALREQGRVDLRQANVSNLPFRRDTFDLVTAVETHYFWPDLPSDLREVFRVLKPGGSFVLVGEVYKGGRHDRRNRTFVELGDMTYLSTGETRDLLLTAGYDDVRTFEERRKGWMCAVAAKPIAEPPTEKRRAQG